MDMLYFLNLLGVFWIQTINEASVQGFTHITPIVYLTVIKKNILQNINRHRTRDLMFDDH